MLRDVTLNRVVGEEVTPGCPCLKESKVLSGKTGPATPSPAGTFSFQGQTVGFHSCREGQEMASGTAGAWTPDLFSEDT